VDIKRCPAASRRGDFALALGRICPEKGFHLAIEAAVGAGCDLILGGRVFPYDEHERYFSTEILPRLDAKRRFIGPVGQTLKRELLCSARCVLIPSLAAETSSLVAMEALMCGAPVIAFRSGALSEILTHGATGFLVSDADEMAQAISQADCIDSLECRKEAAQRFTADRMTDAYIDLYENIITARANFSADSTTADWGNRL
jgi:glycosyltransferase involved in cell wall biosynthesis